MKKIIMLSLAGMIAGMSNLVFGMQAQKSFMMPNGTAMYFNLSPTDVDPQTKILISTYINKRKTENKLPVLALVKLQDNPAKWQLFTAEGLEQKLQSDPTKMSDTVYLKNNIFFFIYDESVAKTGSFLCNGETVFKSAGNDLAQAYRNLVLGKYSPGCNTKTPGCDITKLDQQYKYGPDQKTLLSTLDVMKKSIEAIQKNDGKMYELLKVHLLKYSTASSQTTLRPYNYNDQNEKMYAGLLYKAVRGQKDLPLSLQQDVRLSGVNVTPLVLIDTKGTMIGIIIYKTIRSGDKSVIAISEIIARKENQKPLYDLFEQQMKAAKFQDLIIDTQTEQTSADDIAFFKGCGFTENKQNKAILAKKI